MQSAATPLYVDWSFWAVIVALLAIALSQITPIRVILKKRSRKEDCYVIHQF